MIRYRKNIVNHPHDGGRVLFTQHVIMLKPLRLMVVCRWSGFNPPPGLLPVVFNAWRIYAGDKAPKRLTQWGR